MKKFDIITVGSATEDIFFYTNEGLLIDNKNDVLRQKLLAFEFGAKLKVEKSFALMGGGAINAAVSFSHLGFKTACLAVIGGDIRGKHLVENMEKHEVGTSLIQTIKNGETRFSFVLVGPNNEHIIFTYEGVNSKLEVNAKDLKEMKRAGWVYITSLAGNWRKNLAAIFSVKGPKFAWNPGHIQVKAGIKDIGKYLRQVNVLTVNKDEAIELVVSDRKYKNKKIAFINNINNLLRIIKGYGPEIVVITSGEKGSYAFNGKKAYHQGIFRVKKAADTTGVGDAFGSTFVAGLEFTDGNIQKSLAMAARNAASVVSKLGAQTGLMKKKELVKMLI